MPELLICPKCQAHNFFRATNNNKRNCQMFLCNYEFKLPERLHALKKASRKSYRKLAIEIDVKQRTFENWTVGRTVPDAENMAKIEGLFLKYFGKQTTNNFIAE